MAYNIVGSPDIFSPANNPMYFYIESTNINEEGFKYIVDVYNADSLQRIGSYRLFPRIGDGYGVADINQLLKQEVTYDMNQTNNNILPALNSFVNYEIDFGEEYVQYWDWTDTTFISSGPFSTADYTLVFTSSGNTNPFVSGDTVFLQQNATNESEVYNNVVVTILSANSTSFIVGIPFVSTTTVGGTARFANSQKTQFSGTTVTGYTAFNAAIPHQQFINYTSELYDLTGSTNQFLTNAPQGYTVQPTNQMWLNFYSSDPLNTESLTLTTAYGSYNLVNNNPDKTLVQQIGVGPANITAVENTPDASGSTQWNLGNGTYPVFKCQCWEFMTAEEFSGKVLFTNTNNVESPWYDNFTDDIVTIGGLTGNISLTPNPNQVVVSGFVLADLPLTYGYLDQIVTWYTIQMFSGLTEISEVKLFSVDCSPSRYDNVELVFLDRLGSFIPANFSLQSAKSINITRNEYTKILGDLGNNGANKWGYQSTERGRQNFGTYVKTQVTAISNWITEAEANYLQELYSSQNVYVREYGQLWPVIITSNSYSIVTKNNKKNIQITITFEYANNDTVN